MVVLGVCPEQKWRCGLDVGGLLGGGKGGFDCVFVVEMCVFVLFCYA